jgi:hypothetical protein
MEYDMRSERDVTMLARMMRELQAQGVSFTVKRQGDLAVLVVHSGA